jgi:hypothetical protein
LADTIPIVTVSESPRGLPIAITVAPTFSWSESPSFKTCLDAKSSIPF